MPDSSDDQHPTDTQAAAPSRAMWVAHVVSPLVPLLALVVDIVMLRRLRAEARPLAFRAALAVDALIGVLLVSFAVVAVWQPGALDFTHAGQRERAMIGVDGDSASSARGALITQVRPGLPADELGLVVGDRIAQVDHVDTPSMEAVRQALENKPLHALRVLTIEYADGVREELTVEPTTAYVASPRTVAFRRWVGHCLTAVAALLALWLVLRARRAGVPGALWVLAGCTLSLLASGIVLRLVERGLLSLGTPQALMLGELIALAGAVWLWSRHGRPAAVSGPQLSTVSAYGSGVALLCAWLLRVYYVIVFIMVLADVHMGADEAYFGLLGGGSSSAERLLLGGFVVVLAPAVEELLFRGALLTWLSRFLTPWTAITASALLFTALHAYTHGGTVLQIMVIGMVLGWLRWTTGALQASLMLHATINGISFILLSRL